MRKILFFDTETNGLPRSYKAHYTDVDNWPRLVQLAWIQTDENGYILNESNKVVRPVDFTIPEAASQVHGITQERAIQEGENIADVILPFINAANESMVLVAHNIAFDFNIIAAEFLRYWTPSGQDRFFEMPKYCTMQGLTNWVKAPSKFPGGYKWPTLKELHYKVFGADFEGAHDAMADISATLNCFIELRRIGVIKLDI